VLKFSADDFDDDYDDTWDAYEGFGVGGDVVAADEVKLGPKPPVVGSLRARTPAVRAP
jgi:hypothetical protein